MPEKREFGMEPGRTDQLTALRYVVIPWRGRPFEPREGFRPNRFWHTIVRLDQIDVPVSGRQKLDDGITSIGFAARVRCQATFAYICRWYGLRNLRDLLDFSGHSGSLENLIRTEIASVPWTVLASESGLRQTKQRINKLVQDALKRELITCECICEFSDPEVHVLDRTGKAPRITLGGDAFLQVEEKNHTIEKQSREQRARQASELATLEHESKTAETAQKAQRLQDEHDQTVRLAEITDAGSESSRQREQSAKTQMNAHQLQMKQLELTNSSDLENATRDHRVSTARAESKARVEEAGISATEVLGKLGEEARLREYSIQQKATDETYLKNATELLRLEADRVKLEEQTHNAGRMGELAVEEEAIKRLKERREAERAGEVRIIEQQAKITEQIMSKVTFAPQPIDRLNVLQLQNGANGNNGVAGQVAQTALVLKEVLATVDGNHLPGVSG